MSTQEVVVGDSRTILKQLHDNSFDACVTDPPYELNMMSHGWDRTGIAFDVDNWREVLRVLKPGGHLVVNAAGRLYHRVACAIEDAGFEPREMVAWIFGTGQFLGRSLAPGVGTRLRTGMEPIGIFRKPVENLTEAYALYSTGGLQLDRCRNAYTDEADLAKTLAKNPGRDDLATSGAVDAGRPQQLVDVRGRLPNGVLLDEDVAEELGERARYFYCVKASRRERDLGLEDFPEIAGGKATKRKEGSVGLTNSRAGAGRTGGGKNGHSTVKPLDLVQWCVRLTCPPGGIFLDPFVGSGTTLCAAALEGVSALGIDLSAEYAEIARARVAHWRKTLDLAPSQVLNSLGTAPHENETQGDENMAFLPASMAQAAAKEKATKGREQITDGSYIFMVRNVTYEDVPTEKGAKEKALIIEHTVVESGPNPLKQPEGVKPLPPGAEWGFFMPDYGDAKVMLLKNYKAWALGLLGIDEKTADPDQLGITLDLIGGPKQLARGMYIRGVTYHTTKKNGEDFMGLNWYPVQGENVPDAPGVVARRAAIEAAAAAMAPPAAPSAPAAPANGAAGPPSIPGAGVPTLPVVDPLAGWILFPPGTQPAPDGTPWRYRTDIPQAVGKNPLSEGQIRAGVGK